MAGQKFREQVGNDMPPLVVQEMFSGHPNRFLIIQQEDSIIEIMPEQVDGLQKVLALYLEQRS